MSNQITLHMRFFAAIIVFVLGCDGGKKVVTEEKKADRRVFAADSLVEINGLYFEVGETIPFTGLLCGTMKVIKSCRRLQWKGKGTWN